MRRAIAKREPGEGFWPIENPRPLTRHGLAFAPAVAPSPARGEGSAQADRSWIILRLTLNSSNESKMPKFMITILALWVVLLHASGAANALSCAPRKLDEGVINSSVAIFEGVAGKKHSLTWQQRIAVWLSNLTTQGGDLNNLSVYDFAVTKSWKGAAQGRTVTILFNTYWGDNYLPGGEFLIVSPRQVGDMFWTPLCGASIDLAWARKNRDIATLEKVIGLGHHIKILENARSCASANDCTVIPTHCGGCDCGTPVAVTAAARLKDEFVKFCAIPRVTERCEIDCKTYLPSCHEGLCK